MPVRLEHANLCVCDLEAMIRFLQRAFPEFRVRGEGMTNDPSAALRAGSVLQRKPLLISLGFAARLEEAAVKSDRAPRGLKSVRENQCRPCGTWFLSPLLPGTDVPG
jgi:hypothetical protein